MSEPAFTQTETPEAGTVYLVGAGPGDPELLTLRAARLIAAADIIFHDELVTPEILALTKTAARLIPAGKRSGGPSTPQAQINQLLVDAAQTHRTVVRLKGGDPFIFGRGGEELEYLRAHGVAVEVVPGITAALGCAAEAQLPLTFRNEAVRLTLLTAHRAEDAEGFDYEGLARADTTLAIYMGRDTAGVVARHLIASGRPASTPVAILVNGTRKNSRALAGTLGELGALAAGAGRDPALIVIGEAVRHSAPWHEQAAAQHLNANAA